jgi:hypothetical protein
MNQPRRAVTIIIILTVAISAACSVNTAPKKAAAGTHPLAEGETLGTIEHSPGGTTVASSVITPPGRDVRERPARGDHEPQDHHG